MATAAQPRGHDAYTRRLIYVENRSFVESRCSRCGEIVMGTLMESLIADEVAHLKQCLKRPGRPVLVPSK